ncbi:MAG: UDP-N-acetylmuramoyl-tripeptide--D-alanyl-D-alanine ligase [bacterium]|nr:UDP-N-acetylmuramoyl-tripeptide--D-alanyl-D-alanine ligase [bacterium]
MGEALSYIFGECVVIFFLYKRMLQYLRFFQQEEYKTARFIDWYYNRWAFDKKGSTIILIALFAYVLFSITPWIFVVAALLLLGIALTEEDPKRDGKVTLKMTQRASRIFEVAILSIIILSLSIFYFLYSKNLISFWLIQILLIQSIPFWLILANTLLSPVEKSLQNKFLSEAAKKIKDVNPFIIGITGSYGKTSTKAALGEILNVCLAPTFWPPKSFNTLMGLTKHIREELRYGFKFAVVEMGAYGKGSIAKVCKLTPPKAAIITAVGIMHLERFGSEETVYQAKSELAQALPEDGILVCNGDNDGARRISKEFVKKTTLLYGLDSSKGQLDCKITNVIPTPDGSNFEIEWKGKVYKGQTKLLGTPALSNLAASFTMACILGADPEFVLAAIKNIQPVENRLSISKSQGIVWLKDAYNSNPVGFAAALDVLKEFPGKRKILMTPGMIELGQKQFDENVKIASRAASECDMIFVVGKTNRASFETAAKTVKNKNTGIHYLSSREQAFEEIKKISQEGDVILIENDLTDLYEAPISF